jgi:hypothetical protein
MPVSQISRAQQEAMPVDDSCHDAWWLHIKRSEIDNRFVACPFGVVSGNADTDSQFPLQAIGLVVHLAPS